MEHPHLSVLQREGFKWSLSNVPLLETYLYVLDGDPLQEVVKSVIHQYKTSVVPKYSSFRKCKLDYLLDSFDLHLKSVFYYIVIELMF